MLDHTVVLFLVFSGTSILFSIVVATIYIPINSAQVFPFLHILKQILVSYNPSSRKTCTALELLNLSKCDGLMETDYSAQRGSPNTSDFFCTIL